MWSGLKCLGTHEYVGELLVDAVDWTTRGAVTPVKNVARVWRFRPRVPLEGAWFIATSYLSPLSEQQLVDRDTVDSACQGGLTDNSFAFAWRPEVMCGSGMFTSCGECAPDHPFLWKDAEERGCRLVLIGRSAVWPISG